MIVEEARGVARLQVLRQDQHPYVGVDGADLLRRGQPFVGVGGRHLDVDDRHVGVFGGDDAEELLGISGLAGHLHTGLFEQAGRPLPDQHGVVGDHYPHEISPSIVMAPAGVWPMRSRPPSAPTRSLTSRSAVSRSCPGWDAASEVIRMTSRSPSCFASTAAPSASGKAAMSPLASATRK